MITAKGHSKDPSIIPEGIVVTFGKQMIQEQGGLKTFLKEFDKIMCNHDQGIYWLHSMSNFPTIELDHIYIVIANRLYGKVYCGGFNRNHDANITAYTTIGKQKMMDKPFVILSGPLEKCPYKRNIKGFQGFRYCTKLF